MDMKLYRNNENKIHEHLFNNIYLLRQFYSTSTDFNRVFKKDMFVKNNKTAFFEVVHYLLTILNPEQSKEKLTMWPPYDSRRENKFRTEVLTYVNELNILYEYAYIPHIMQSHLICPGGYKFTKFMLKLSELVVFEHLRKNNYVELYCPVPNDNCDFYKNYFKKQTDFINSKDQEQLKEFQSYYIEAQNKAKKIDQNLTNVNKSIVEEKMKNTKTREEFNSKYSFHPPRSLCEKIQYLRNEWSNLQPIHALFKSCGSLLKDLSSNKFILEHKKDEFKVPNEIIHIIKNRDILDLTDFFQGLNILLEHRALDLPNITKSFIQRNVQKINILCLRYMEILETYKDEKSQIQTVMCNLLENTKGLEASNYIMDSTVLCPLPD